MEFASWMECSLSHMWAMGDGDHCPVCGQVGWLRSERVSETATSAQRAVVVQHLAEMQSEISHLRKVVAEQARHHQNHHAYCSGLPV